jgi:hypothetical protein
MISIFKRKIQKEIQDDTFSTISCANFTEIVCLRVIVLLASSLTIGGEKMRQRGRGRGIGWVGVEGGRVGVRAGRREEGEGERKEGQEKR